MTAPPNLSSQRQSALYEQACRLSAGVTMLAHSGEPPTARSPTQTQTMPRPRRLSTSSDSSSLSELSDLSQGTSARAPSVTTAATSAPAWSPTATHFASDWRLDQNGDLTAESKRELWQLAKDVLRTLDPTHGASPPPPRTAPTKSAIQAGPLHTNSNSSDTARTHTPQAASRQTTAKKPSARKPKDAARVGAHIGGIKQCRNCSTMDTPLWRRGPSKELLCNACALFLKHRGKPRPSTSAQLSHSHPPLQPSDDDEHTERSLSPPRQQPQSTSCALETVCTQCRADTALVWREVGDHLLCNVCWSQSVPRLSAHIVRRSGRKRRLTMEDPADPNPSDSEDSSDLTSEEAHIDPPDAQERLGKKAKLSKTIQQHQGSDLQDQEAPMTSFEEPFSDSPETSTPTEQEADVLPLRTSQVSLPPLATLALPTPPPSYGPSTLPSLRSLFLLSSSPLPPEAPSVALSGGTSGPSADGAPAVRRQAAHSQTQAASLALTESLRADHSMQRSTIDASPVAHIPGGPQQHNGLAQASTLPSSAPSSWTDPFPPLEPTGSSGASPFEPPLLAFAQRRQSAFDTSRTSARLGSAGGGSRSFSMGSSRAVSSERGVC